MSSLMEQLNQVSSRESFLRFAEALRRDFASKPGTWENGGLDSFLEALAAWTSDMDGYYRNRGEAIPTEPSWKVLAEMLYAAKSYE